MNSLFSSHSGFARASTKSFSTFRTFCFAPSVDATKIFFKNLRNYKCNNYIYAALFAIATFKSATTYYCVTSAHIMAVALILKPIALSSVQIVKSVAVLLDSILLLKRLQSVTLYLVESNKK